MQQIPIATPDHVLSRVPPFVLSRSVLLKPFVLNDLTQLLLANTRSGNIFNDRFNSNLRWYLPKYELAADPDQFFSFSASQSGVDNSGNPFNKGMVTLS